LPPNGHSCLSSSPKGTLSSVLVADWFIRRFSPIFIVFRRAQAVAVSLPAPTVVERSNRSDAEKAALLALVQAQRPG
jgi:hypothetical protein